MRDFSIKDHIIPSETNDLRQTSTGVHLKGDDVPDVIFQLATSGRNCSKLLHRERLVPERVSCDTIPKTDLCHPCATSCVTREGL